MNIFTKMISNKMAATLISAMMITGALGSMPLTAMAEPYDTLDSGLVGKFTFDDATLTNLASDDKKAQMYTQGATVSYDGVAVFGSDRTSDTGNAVRLGDYGLDLDLNNIGTDYTISAWLKPDGYYTGWAHNNIFLGTSDNWMGLAGRGVNTDEMMFWGLGGIFNNHTQEIPSAGHLVPDLWHHVIISGSDGHVDVYLDGEKTGSGRSNNPLVGENARLFVGVNYWDALFKGLADDIYVYNRVLTTDERERLFYNGVTAEEYVKENGAVIADQTAIVGINDKLEADVPGFVENATGYNISYAVSDNSIANVDEETGELIPLKSGTTEFYVTVSVGESSKTNTAVLTVNGVEEVLVGQFTFDEEDLSDLSGKADAKALETGLTDSNDELKFEAGRTAEAGKAIRLGDYGLDLNRYALGTDYTVSMWLKPDGGFTANQIIVALGHGVTGDEHWMSLAGGDAGGKNVKFWAQDPTVFTGHNTLGTTELDSTMWHNVVFAGNSTSSKVFIDGELKIEAGTSNPLVPANGGILVGVNNWDPGIVGLADDILVYNVRLNDAYIADAYETELEKMKVAAVQKGTIVNDLEIPLDDTDTITYTLPSLIKDEVTVEYLVEDTDIATVDDKGLVTPDDQGETRVGVTITYKDVSATFYGKLTITPAAGAYDTLDRKVIGKFTFDDGKLENLAKSGKSALMYKKNATERYDGAAVFGDDRTSVSGNSVRLGDYGLDLDLNNIGTDYTISAWLKPDGYYTGWAHNNIFLGTADNWMGLAGKGANTDEMLFWGLGGIFNNHTQEIPSAGHLVPGKWHHVIISGSDGHVDVYLDGEKTGSGRSNNPLVGENARLFVGVNYWDALFAGLADDIIVYNRVLTSDEKERLFYNGMTAEEYVQKYGATIEDQTAVLGMPDKISAKVPGFVENATGYQIRYAVSDNSIAAVDEETGDITPLKSGSTRFSVTVSLGDVSKTNTALLTVNGLDGVLVGQFTFDKEDLSDLSGGTAAKAIEKGLGDSADNPVFEAGRTADAGKAIRLGDYGLDLNRYALGTDYTVSMWLKPDGGFSANQIIVALGHGVTGDEHWMSLSGGDGGGKNVKFWAQDPTVFTGHNTLGTTELDSSMWHNVVFAGNSTSSKVYIDGKLKIEAGTSNPLVPDNGGILVGANFWDTCYAGLADDILVYNVRLNDAYIADAYAAELEAMKLSAAKEGAVVEPLKIALEETGKIRYSLPAIIADEAKVEYSVTDTSYATVSQNGVVSPLKPGETKIGVTVTYGDIVTTTYGKLTITGEIDPLIANFTFDNGDLKDLKEGSAAVLKSAGYGSYAGAGTYVDGRTAEAGKAIKLGSYGLDVNRTGVGKEYTLSYWVKPDGKLPTNRAVVLLGSSDPERWMGMAGQNGSNTVKYWACDNFYFNTWTTIATPDISSDRWHNVAIAGKEGEAKLYIDGKLINAEDTRSNDPLDTESGRILIGTTYWSADNCFPGAVDDVMVYRVTLSENGIKNYYYSELAKMIEAPFEAAVRSDALLGNNVSGDEIKYDLSLPFEVSGEKVVWSSSDDTLMSDDGEVVKAPAADTKVTMTATISFGETVISKTRDFTLKVLDRKALDELVVKAKAIDKSKLTKNQKTRLEDAIDEAQAADTYAKVDAVVSKLAQLVKQYSKDNVSNEEEDPFEFITEPVSRVTIDTNFNRTIFTLSENVAPYVDVVYSSNDEEVVKYNDGMITAGATPGKAIVTATVTAKYDGFTMEYSTAVLVDGDVPGPGPEPGPAPGRDIPAIVKEQNEKRAAAISGKQGAKNSPQIITVLQGAEDGLTLSENYIKGKAKEYALTPVSDKDAENIVTVNAGIKIALRGGNKNSYRIVTDSNGGINAKGTSSKSAKVNSKGILKIKPVKGVATYSIKVEYDRADGNGKYVAVLNVENLSFSPAYKKTVLYSVAGEVKTKEGQVIKTVDDKLTGEEIKVCLSDAVSNTKDSSIISGMWSMKGSAATMTVAGDGRSVTLKPVAGAKGKVTVFVNLNGKKYKTSVKVLGDTVKPFKAGTVTPTPSANSVK